MASNAAAQSAAKGEFRKSSRSGQRLWLGLLFGITGYIGLVPLVVLIYGSFTAGENQLPFESGTVSLANYRAVFADPGTYEILWNTLVFTVCATVLGLGIAVLFAWLIERTNIPWRTGFYVAILVPMAIPSMIYAIAWTNLLGPNNGLINTWLLKLGLIDEGFNIFSLWGMILVQGFSLASNAYLLIAAAFRTLDPTWEEQSAIAGKGVFRTFGRITLPALKPALLSAILFYTLVAMEVFDIPGTLGLTARIHVLSTRIYWATHPDGGGLPNYGLASSMGVILLVAATGLIVWYQKQTRQTRQYVTISGKAYRDRPLDLGKWRIPMFLLALSLTMLIVVLPIAMLVWRSLLRFYVPPSLSALKLLTLNAYHNVMIYPEMGRTLWNTLVMGFGSALSVLVLGAAIGWMVLRAPVRQGMRDALQFLAILPKAVPSVVAGLALMLFYLRLPLPVYGTVWILILAMLTRYLSFGASTMLSAQIQISGELEEASQIAGAGPLRTYRRVVLPLLTPALVNCLLWVLVHVLRELSLVIMLYSPSTKVISTAVWGLWESGSVSESSALGVMMSGVLVVLFFGGRYLVERLGRTEGME